MDLYYLQIIIPLILLPVLLLLYWRLRLKKLGEYTSPTLGKIEVFEKYNKEKVLTINSYPEGVSIEDKSIENSYFYKAAKITAEHCQHINSPQILMLGLGANTISSLIAKINPDIHQTIVEIDASIIQACKDFFKLENLNKFTLLHTDAFELINKPDPTPNTKHLKPNSFDSIIVDIFVGTPTMIPHQSNQPRFIEKLVKFLNKDGVIIFNRPGNAKEAVEGTYQLKKYLEKLFTKVEVIYIEDPRRYKNHLIVGSHLL